MPEETVQLELWTEAEHNTTNIQAALNFFWSFYVYRNTFPFHLVLSANLNATLHTSSLYISPKFKLLQKPVVLIVSQVIHNRNKTKKIHVQFVRHSFELNARNFAMRKKKKKNEKKIKQQE